MFFFLRNEPRIVTLVRCGFLAILTIALLIMGTVDLIRMNAKPIDLNETHMDWNYLESGQHVEMDVDILIGAYMTTSRDGRETERDYLMPHVEYDSYNDYYDIDRVIGVKVNSADIPTAETIVANTERWWRDSSGTVEYNTVTIHIDGYLKKMNGSQIEYCREAMTEAGFTPHDLASMIVPYYISDNEHMGVLFLVIGGICAVCTAFLTIYAFKKKQY